MRSDIRPDHPLRTLFRGLVEQVFMTELGVCDLKLIDYLGNLLLDFVHMDRIYRMQTVDGEVIRDVSRLQAEACLGGEYSEAEREWLINRYIGDFTLFWSGVYPEHLHPSRNRGLKLHGYLVQGKRSYGIASALSPSDVVPPAALLRQLSEQFELCVHGLHLVRANWEHESQPPSDN
ncbi:MAG: hypothetical protein KKB50_11830 [Planctomycetes bacterium]|nr:hypothetical protein [Planctomycetota bacterium]